MSEHQLYSHEAFLTQAEDNEQLDPPSRANPITSPMQLLHQLEEEKVDLESQVAELRQQLADAKNRISSCTGFAPLASIFPMQRDPFGETKCASKQLKIYRKERKHVASKFKRANDTTYAYELERVIERKEEKVRSLERQQATLKASNVMLERHLLKLKSDEKDQNDAAEMLNLASHVTLMRDQVRILEKTESQNRELYQASEEAWQHAQTRYNKMKFIAKQLGVSLKARNNQEVKKMYEVFALRLKRMQKRNFFQEDQRLKELKMEKVRLELMAKNMEEALMNKEIDLNRNRKNITTLRKVGGASERISPKLRSSISRLQLKKDTSLPLTSREMKEEHS